MNGRQMKTWGLAVAALVLVGTAVGATQLLATAKAPNPAEGAAPFVVHEWGTFTTFSGADGKNLAFNPQNDDLPRFVYESAMYNLISKSPRRGSARGTMAMVSMETPVLYFYTDRELTASVSVDFPKGFMTEWYPHAKYVEDKSHAAKRLIWNDFKLRPGAYVSLPRQGNRDNHYYAARETDATPLEVALDPAEAEVTRLDGTFSTDKEYEKFLFYRGLGNFDVPLQVSTGVRCGGLFARNQHKEPMAGLFLVSVKDGVLSFADMTGLKGGEQKRALTPRPGTVAELSDAVAKVLVSQGLYEKEARAMVKTWSNSWFGEEGTRFLYILPTPLADELLPLKVTPKPDSLVRVFVGRHDILSRDQEAKIDGLNKRLQAAQAEIQAAQEGMANLKLGRFTSAAVNQSTARINTPK